MGVGTTILSQMVKVRHRPWLVNGKPRYKPRMSVFGAHVPNPYS